MSDSMDRRKARTKQSLYKALIELMEKKGLDGITVTDITNWADINRGTFYLHYRDVADMLEQLKDEAFEQVRSLIQQLDIMELIECGRSDQPYQKLVAIFEEFARNCNFFKVMFGPKGDLAYMNQYKELMKTQIFKKLNYWKPNGDSSLVPLDYLIAYMTSANLGVLLHWFETGMKKSPHEIGLIMTRIVSQGPIVSLGLGEND
ncbi:TetR/AcrR family transcriptional regulator [Paenibacillus eucommiae]|uniref:AcrR family transcriptional regulator n=1 Tax=Paenibacillus eucommiae TaxID=1355755 RepID=A0ABS4J891_9BACL|nr:TetR/AcrR family transcriptional regulator [Paenibacillus eucommiae]MBP1996043.1 AcrR family transcriptional regulator [Paenibacillus eucommiae]